MAMTEKIGNITLDYRHYPGEDLYCDGAVEDKLLEIVKSTPVSGYAGVIERARSWPVLYHLSPLRGNIVDWIPLDKGMKVLEVGSGCGAVTGTLAAKAGEVACIELSKKRSHINAWRNKEASNVTIHVGNFQDIEPELPSDYDYIFLIGVFEYAKSYIGTDRPYENFMKILKPHLKGSGRLVIAIENKFGMKYWAGCKEDHLGTYFEGIEDYPSGAGVRTFTRNGLETICKSAGIEQYSFYYPYPDYKFCSMLYSDAYLPKVGELSTNLVNYDRERMLLFDEKNAFDSVIREGLFPLFSNSYVLVTGEELPVRYCKYSNDRAPRFAVRTEISKGPEGELLVRKIPVSAEAEGHIAHIKDAYRKLKKRYEGSGLEINRLSDDGISDDGISDGGKGILLEYVEGRTLEEELDGCIERGDREGFHALVERYIREIGFGRDEPVTDYDLIFGNIIVKEDGWTVLDYEWTFDRRTSPEESALRALYCYMLGSVKRREPCLSFIREWPGLAEESLERAAGEEAAFQKYVTGDRLSLNEIRNRIGFPILPAGEIAQRQAGRWGSKRVQLYEDRGEGFSEEGSYFIEDAYEGRESYGEGNRIVFRAPLPADVRSVRIDPALEPCMVTVRRLDVYPEGERPEASGKEPDLREEIYILNGNLISKNTVVFPTGDPNITIDIRKMAGGVKTLEAELEIVALPQSMAEAAAAGKKETKKRRFF